MTSTKTKVKVRNDYTSTTDPNSPHAVPAFETSAGIPPRSPAQKPVFVDQRALETFNANVDPVVAKNQIEAANVAALFAKKAIRPDEIAALRRRMFEVVTDGLEDVDKVMKGTKTWNNVQTRLFSVLVERVMPKLSTISVEDPSKKKLEDLTIEELEAIALGKRKHEAVDAVVKEGQKLDKSAAHAEAISAGFGLKKLTQIASLDDAERVYKDKKASKGVTRPKKPSTEVPNPSSQTSPEESAKDGD